MPLLQLPQKCRILRGVPLPNLRPHLELCMPWASVNICQQSPSNIYPHNGNIPQQAAGKGTLGQLAGLVGPEGLTDPGDVPHHARSEYSVAGPGFHPINFLVSSMEQVEHVCAETGWDDNAFIHHQNSMRKGGRGKFVEREFWSHQGSQ